jgi:cytochrome c peroxidase
MKAGKLIAVAGFVWLASLAVSAGPQEDRSSDRDLNERLAKVLKQQGFTGEMQFQLEKRLGRRVDQDLANIGRLLWFDPVHSLHQDNTCAGCHSPSNGFGDTQSIAIGVDNNNKVGPSRKGPRNQRRSPLVVNTAFYPKLMWNGRFSAIPKPGQLLGNPFTNKYGFEFPLPEGTSMFPPNDPLALHLLHAQAHIPPTELVEVAGFSGVCPGGVAGPGVFQEQCQFDNGKGDVVPGPDGSGFRNQPIRDVAIELINDVPKYRRLFAGVFPSVARGAPIDFKMFGRAISEFEFSLTFADAPIDQFARGDRRAMTAEEKRGALVFFGVGRCVECHAVKGQSNEMFSDFENRVAGIVQLAPQIVGGKSNMVYDGDGLNEDVGLQQVTGLDSDRYKFRTAPLRNIALSPAFFHNGAFTNLEKAIRYHINPEVEGPRYNPARAGVARDLAQAPRGPLQPVLDRLDPILRGGIDLRNDEINDVTQFVRSGLLDRRAEKEDLCSLVPKTLPSGLRPLEFEACKHPGHSK